MYWLVLDVFNKTLSVRNKLSLELSSLLKEIERNAILPRDRLSAYGLQNKLPGSLELGTFSGSKIQLLLYVY